MDKKRSEDDCCSKGIWIGVSTLSLVVGISALVAAIFLNLKVSKHFMSFDVKKTFLLAWPFHGVNVLFIF